jgi:serine/threonine protein kinase
MTQTRCMGCMTDKGAAAVCPRCGFVESDQPATPAHLPPRTLLQARYVVGRVLGEGGFGITYLGWDETLALRVAIKEFLPHYLATRSADGVSVQVYQSEKMGEFAYGLEKFLDEARLLARFADHPGIVAVRDFFAANRTGYLVMNYLDGMTFQNYLASQGGRIPIDRALRILTPVMDTLQEIHAAGLLHRDISPDNLFLPVDKPAKLIDFGAARAALGEHSGSLSVIVKAGYAPEEQYRSHGQQGPWTDVYALGATFYGALTGQRPPPAPDRLHQDALLPPSGLGAVLPRAAESVLLRALAVRAEQRFQAVGDFQAALAWALEGVGVADRALAPTMVSVTPAAPVAGAEPASARPEVLKDRYWLVENLERSEWGATFLAVDQDTRQQCLIKRFSLQRADDWKSLELFEREAKTLKHLNHPHIPSYLDYFTGEKQDDQQLFLVREHIPGKTLAQCLADGRHFVEREVVAMAGVLAEVLCYLHQFSPPLIHRDIKPDSILLSEDQQIYLVDFGAVQDCLKPGEGFTVVGTFDYLPPEQKKGKTVPASDIYSLGATLIHLLSRIPPSRLQGRDQRLQFRSQVNISREFGQILEKMVEPRLERRYRTAADLLTDLRALDAPAQPGRDAKAFDRRWLIAGLVGFLLAGGAIGLWWWYRGSMEERVVPLGPTVDEALPTLQRAIQEALQKAAMVKTAVAEYLMSMGKLPNTNAELGLPDPSAYQSTLLESLSVLSGGLIVAKLSRKAVAGGGTIYLKPTANPAVGFIEWQCVSPDLGPIARIAQGCVYQPESSAGDDRNSATPPATPATPGARPLGIASLPIRAWVSEGVIAANQAKVAVAEYYQNHGSLPSDSAAIGLKSANWASYTHVKSLSVGQGGTITVIFQNLGLSQLDGNTLVFVPQLHGGSLRWDCANQGTLPPQFRPIECRP